MMTCASTPGCLAPAVLASKARGSVLAPHLAQRSLVDASSRDGACSSQASSVHVTFAAGSRVHRAGESVALPQRVRRARSAAVMHSTTGPSASAHVVTVTFGVSMKWPTRATQ